MKITFNAITANGALTKAMVRHAETLAALKRIGVFVSTEDLAFDILQVVLLDRDASYARAAGCRNDRLFQFEVAAPNSAEVNFADLRAFVGCLAERLKVAVNGCGLPKQTAAELVENIEAFKSTI